MDAYPYRYAWANNPKRLTLHDRRCRVIVRGIANSALVEFENGQREVISRNALRRGKKLKECVEALKQIEGYAGCMTPAGISNLADKALTFDGGKIVYDK